MIQHLVMLGIGIAMLLARLGFAERMPEPFVFAAFFVGVPYWALLRVERGKEHLRRRIR